jgi:hypothetical protein
MSDKVNETSASPAKNTRPPVTDHTVNSPNGGSKPEPDREKFRDFFEMIRPPDRRHWDLNTRALTNAAGG